MSKLTNVKINEMTTISPNNLKDNDTTDHSCSNNSNVIQHGPFDSDAMLEIVEISDVCFVHLFLQNAQHAVVKQLANLEVTVAMK